MSIKSGISTGTPSEILFGAGVFFSGVTYSETVAPTESQIKSALVGATQEGGKLTITPEFFAPEVDGVYVALKELQNKVGEKATLETSMIQMNADTIAKAVIGTKSASTDTNYDVITSSDVLTTGHFYSGFGYYGELMDGRPFICLFKTALCTSGFAAETKNKENSKFSGVFECQGDIEYGTQKLPYALFIRKSAGWTPVTGGDVSGSGSGGSGGSGGST